MTHKYKLVLWFVVLSVCLFMASIPAFAVGQRADRTLGNNIDDSMGNCANAGTQPVTVQVGELFYTLDEGLGTATVVRPGADSPYTFAGVSIPAKVSYEEVEYAVTEIGEAAFGGAKNLEGIAILSNIRKIGKGAFTGCFSLKEMRIEPATEPLDVPLKIFDNAAEDVPKLAPLYCYIGRPLNLVAGQHFLYNSGVVKCEIENVANVTRGYFFEETLKELVLHKGVVEIGSLMGSHSLEYINIPEGVEEMTAGSFDQCESLKSAVIPSTMQQLSGFYESPNLTEVSLYCLTPPATYYDHIELYPFHAEGKGVIHVLPEAVEAYASSLWGKYPEKYSIQGDLTMTQPEATVTLTLQTEGPGSIRITEAGGEAFTGESTPVSDTEEQAKVPAQAGSIKVVVCPDAGQEITRCEVLGSDGGSLPMTARVTGQGLEIGVAPAEGLRVKAAFSPCATSTLRLQLPSSGEEEAMHLSQAAGSPYSISYFVTPGYRIASVWLDQEPLQWQTPATDTEATDETEGAGETANAAGTADVHAGVSGPMAEPAAVAAGTAGADAGVSDPMAEPAAVAAGTAGVYAGVSAPMAEPAARAKAKIVVNVPGFEGEKTLRIVEESLIITDVGNVTAGALREMVLRPCVDGGAELSGLAPGAAVRVTGTDGMVLYTGTATSAGTLRLPATLSSSHTTSLTTTQAGILLISSPNRKTLRTRL